jgi:hypothetical protein
MENQIQNRFAMRHLTEQELKLVQQAMIKKHITSTELLMEIYDHYICHLEGFPEGEFEVQLQELNKKWTASYCEYLQKNLFKNINKSIRTTQWNLIKSYFSWPKSVLTLLILIGISFLANSLDGKMQGMVLIMPTITFLFLFMIYVIVKELIILRKFKILFRGYGLKMSSTFNRYFLTYLLLPISIFNLVIGSTKNHGSSNLFPEGLSNYLIVSCCFFLWLYSISAFQTWKIKSKTALL